MLFGSKYDHQRNYDGNKNFQNAKKNIYGSNYYINSSTNDNYRSIYRNNYRDNCHDQRQLRVSIVWDLTVL